MELVMPALGLLFWQTITLILVLLVLSKYVWKPIMSGLKEREQSIETAINQAEAARKEMEKVTLDKQNLLDEARSEREKILKSAQKTADEIREEAKSKAMLEVNKMIENAHKSIETEKQRALVSIKEQIATLSIEVASKLLVRELENKEKQELLAADLIRDLNIN